jgi:hypothetical protein
MLTLPFQAIGYAVIGGLAIPFIKERLPVVSHRSAEYQTAPPVSWEFLRKSAFYAFLVGGAVFSLGVTLPGIYMPSYAVDLGLSKTVGSALVTVMNGELVVCTLVVCPI